MGLKYTKRAMTSYEVHRFFHGLEVSFFPDTLLYLPISYFKASVANDLFSSAVRSASAVSSAVRSGTFC